ncbi:aminotransferase class III-fold pyridoxal phosphate-dependent enzyme [Methylosinus sporium]|nr:aminotransferase class III-fold pyridoxal phosphate-dependent enzyme [Methylosinus sporium]
MAQVNLLSSRSSHLNSEGVYPAGWRIVSAKNCDVVLEREGRERRFVDLTSSYGAVNFGHRNPQIDPFLDAPADLTTGCYPREADDLSSWLCERLRLPFHRVLFQVGGSFAVTSALAIAQRQRPGKIVAIAGAFHGLGLDSLAATTAQRDWALQDSRLAKHLRTEVVHIHEGDPEPDWNKASCFLFEPVQGANGYIPLDLEWIGNLVDSARSHGVTIIADEIQAGFFRHGHLSPTRSAGIDSDIHLFSKSMTNGQSPLSAVVYDERFDEAVRLDSALAHTFQTSVYGYRAGSAVALYLDANPPFASVNAIQARLECMAIELRTVVGVEQVHVTGPSLSFGLGRPSIARAAILECFERGIMILGGGAGGERIRVAPPLTIDAAALDESAEIVLDVLARLPLQ